MSPRHRAAFTLVEILIVVVILAILAVVTVPQMVRASDDAQVTATTTELHKLRRHIGVFWARNQRFPGVVAGNGTWGEIVGAEYLMAAPTNSWVGGANSRAIILGNTPDVAYHRGYGWIFDPATGEVWAGSYDALDNPIPR